MKWIGGILLLVFILICGCSSEQSTVVEPNNTITTPTPVAVTATWIQTTVGPTPTPTDNMDVCYFKNVTDYPQYCYDHFYWVRPTYSPPGAGYSARVWRNDGCINLNRTSGLCEGWGNGLYTEIFMKNRTIVRNLSGIELLEVISAASYYNRTFDLNTINGGTFSEFIDKYWDGTYPSVKYDTDLFTPDLNTTIVPVDTFDPYGF